MLKKLAIIATLIIWPLSLFLANTLPETLTYFLPALIIQITLLSNQKPIIYLLFTAIPLIEPKLAPLPLLFFLFQAAIPHKNLKLTPFIALSIVVLFIQFKPFLGQTIFIKDYEARQQILRNINLYPHPLFARTFENKARIRLDKFNSRLFALIDPNNYFFSFHPREIILENQNLLKFPSLSIIPFLLGIYYLPKLSKRNLLISLGISSLLSLSILTNFDRHDFLLWPIITTAIIHGLNQLQPQSLKTKTFLLILLLLAILETINILLT